MNESWKINNVCTSLIIYKLKVTNKIQAEGNTWFLKVDDINYKKANEINRDG